MKKQKTKQNKKQNLYLSLLIGSILAILIGLLSMAGGLMSSNMTEEALGDVFDVFFIPLLLFIIPLIFIKISLKKLYSYQLASWIIYLAVIFSIIFSFIAAFGQTYNYFIQKDEAIKKAFSDVEVIYVKKLDLIPGIALSIDKYTEHEKDIVGRITEARETVNKSKNVNDQVKALNSFDSNLRSIMINQENYPNLNSSDLVLELIYSIKDVENEIADKKQIYNEEIETFNKNYKMFPYHFIADIAGHEEKIYFKNVE